MLDVLSPYIEVAAAVTAATVEAILEESPNAGEEHGAPQ